MDLCVCVSYQCKIFLVFSFQNFFVADTVRHFQMQAAGYDRTVFFEKPCQDSGPVTAEKPHGRDNENSFPIPDLPVCDDIVLEYFRNIAELDRVAYYDFARSDNVRDLNIYEYNILNFLYR